MKALNPLTLPLHGRQVIEASAGTGKTWTLAALYLRLVLGHERTEALLPPQILVMTFTEAATAELRERIRTRLSQAASYFDGSAQGRDSAAALQVDGFLQTLRDSFEPALWPRCALQLHCAAEWMDDAAIYTIHGWSRRMLTQHALESRNLFEQTRLENADQLKLTLVQDYWREWFYPLPVNTLHHITPLIGQDPAKLLKELNAIWQDQERKPRPVVVPEVSPHQAIDAHMAWQAKVEATAASARAAWNDAVLQALQDAGAQKKIKGLRADYFANWLKVLQAWKAQDPNDPTSKDTYKVLARFTTQALQDKGWHEAEGFAFFGALQDHLNVCNDTPTTQALIAIHAAHAVGHAYQDAKSQRAAFDFSDLLQNLHNAVKADDARLATAIRQQYPVALVDEFQDTDPWQYGTLNRIYAHDACTPANALVMIGDPKQAIYSFRGADLGTYIKARDDALAINPDALHTLTGNHRSSEGLVKAVNHVFMQTAQPFASTQGAIEFVEVSAQGQAAALVLNGQQHPPFTVWQMHPEGDGDGDGDGAGDGGSVGEAKVVRIASYLHHTASVFADQMADLLNQGAAHPSEMAVLVRNQKQADAMRHALQARHIPSVYLSDHTSVYQSSEATDLWRLLRAVASPRQTAWVRAALGSRLWVLDLHEVLAITQDEVRWEQLLDQFHHWHTLWQQQGVLPMLHHWLHSQQVAQRMLAQADGECRLSNLLHLGELLQHAAQSLQGELALVRHLGEQIQTDHHDSDAQQARLETDALCVKVITYHKSKGLQYPLVFVPYAGAFTIEKKPKTKFALDDKSEDSEDDNDAEPTSVEEDMRLLYVALTRAQRGLWMGVAETKSDLSKATSKTELKRSALSQLLNRQAPGDLGQQLKDLWASCPHIQVARMPELQHISYQKQESRQATHNAHTPTRSHHSLWWTASFSAITRGLVSESKRDEAVADAMTDAQAEEVVATQSPAPETISAWQSFPAGARYGTLLHDLLEWLSHNNWPVAQTQPQAPAWSQQAWAELLARKASWLQLDDASRAQLEPWLKAIVQTPLPLHALDAPPLTLSQLSAEHLWPEMEFNLEVGHVKVSALDQLVQRHVFEGSPRPALQTREMQGMLTGSMDLVLQHAGRYWVVDYKSNKLPGYDPNTLQHAVLHKRYEVQYVLYTLALHRLLKVRLPGYDYAQHMGGAVYLFLRGIHAEGAGVHLCRPPQALIESLDDLFSHPLPLSKENP